MCIRDRPKDVTVTDNQLPIDGGIAESGSYTLTKRTAVKNTPSDTAVSYTHLIRL